MSSLLDRCRRRWEGVIILKFMVKGRGRKKIWAEKFLSFVKPRRSDIADGLEPSYCGLVCSETWCCFLCVQPAFRRDLVFIYCGHALPPSLSARPVTLLHSAVTEFLSNPQPK